ncbi:MAG TPA: hypothetical protein VH518_07105 [Tepidisphaeraceae bacterium]|jgi:hypothetical protein
MNKHHHILFSAAACVVALPALRALGQVDGAVGAGEFNVTLATQTNTTGFGDNQSELNQGLARLSAGGELQLMLTGNLEANGNGLVIFLDTKAGGVVASTTAGGYGVFGSVGGQRTDDWGTDTDGGATVLPTPNGPSVVSPGFNPDMSIELNAGGGGPNYFISVIDMTVPNEPNANRDIFLPDPADNTRSGQFNGPSVTSTYLRDSGATNAGTVTFAFNNTNTAGVNGDGNPAGLGDPATATTGFESLLSTLFLNADPGVPIKLMAFITNGGGDFLSNQFLPGLPLGTGNLGFPGGPFGGNPLFDAENGFTPSLASLYMTVPFPEWGNTGGGSWSVDGNWLVVRPDGINTTAKFGSAITGNTVVNVDGDHTVGAVIFDNSTFSYALGGTGTLTFDALTGKTTRIIVNAGSHSIDVPMNWQKDMRISVAGSSSLTLNGAITAAPGITLTKDGTGAAQLRSVRTDGLVVQEGVLRVKAGGTPNIPANTSIVKSLSISPGASLDLTNNSMIIDYTDPVGTQVSGIRDHLKNGRLTTSSGTATTRLGYGDNAILGKTTFAGQSVDTSSILIKYTYAGDADLDGDADGVDIGTWATNFTGELGGAGSQVWTQGDWDYDGDVDGVDAGLWAQAFTGELGGAGLGSLVVNDPNIAAGAAAILRGMGITLVPEPVAVGLLAGFAAMATNSRRHRRRN